MSKPDRDDASIAAPPISEATRRLSVLLLVLVALVPQLATLLL